MKNTFFTASELSRLTGVSRQAISKAAKEGRLHRDPRTEKYDATHKINSAFIASAQVKTPFPETKPGKLPEGMEQLYERKLRADAIRSERQAQKMGLALAREQDQLIKKSDVARAFGAFRFAISAFLFPVAARVARGDAALKERIEGEVNLAIQKIIEHAQSEVMKIIRVEIEGETDAEKRN